MSILKDLLDLKVQQASQQSDALAEAHLDEARGGADVGELVDQWMEHNKIYSMEGSRGERNLEKLIRVIGYGSMSEFLQDNSGCIEAMVEWIKDQRAQEWADGLKGELPGSDDDDEDDDDK